MGFKGFYQGFYEGFEGVVGFDHDPLKGPCKGSFGVADKLEKGVKDVVKLEKGL